MEPNLTYFQRRASEEEAAALRAAHPGARQAHLDMAQGYAHLIGGLAEDERKLGTSEMPQAFAELEATGPETKTAALAR